MAKTPNGFEIIRAFEQFSPRHLAMEGDKIGLQIGTLNKPVTNVMVALDVLEEVVDEAIEKDVQLIIAHHPLIYRPLQKIATDQASGRIVEKLIKHDIALYVAHTNLDVAEGGVNDWLAEALGLQNTKVLVPTHEQTLKKLAVFVPLEAEMSVKEALGNAGAGHIGNYSHCTFAAKGTGTFLPGDGTNPHIGSSGKLEAVSEVRIETVFPAELERKVVQAMIKAHPYEEVAYDIYELANEIPSLGLGRIGELQEEMTLEAFALHAKEAFDVESLRVVGDLSGFAASAYMRGIDFYNVPTTLLSQIDSSIGGKTAVNLGGVKNIVGAFYQPKKVLVDPDLLSSLPKRQISNGLAEAVKMALTSDSELFDIFENGDVEKSIDEIIIRSLNIKKSVVEQDEKEAGLRRILNFGHTVGHGIESSEGMSELYHGECVALGMIPMCSEAVRPRLVEVLKKCGLYREMKYDWDRIAAAAFHDKKADGGTVTVTTVSEVGSFEMKTVKCLDVIGLAKDCLK